MCLDAAAYCPERGGKHPELGHIRLRLAGAEICQASANFVRRGSELVVGARVKSVPTEASAVLTVAGSSAVA